MSVSSLKPAFISLLGLTTLDRRPQRALHSILAGRTILHLKEQSSQRLVEYDSHPHPKPRSGHTEPSGPWTSDQGHANQSFALSEFHTAAPPHGRWNDAGDTTVLTTGPFNMYDEFDTYSEKPPTPAKFPDAERGSRCESPSSKLVPLRRQRTLDSGEERESTVGGHSCSPLRNGVKVFVHRQQTVHI